jgi:hypothetical protein
MSVVPFSVIQGRKQADADRIVEEQARLDQMVEDEIKHKVEVNTDAIVKSLEGLIALAKAGRVDGLVLMAHDPVTGLFRTDISMRDGVVPPKDTLAYLGCFEALKMELVDAAQLAPYISMTGEVVDPYEQLADMEEME